MMKRLIAATFALLLSLPLAAQERPAQPGARPRPDREERVVRVENREERGWIGIRFAKDEAETAAGGVKIVEVSPNSPAERAGLRAGDVLLRIDGRPATPTSLVERRFAPGETLRLRIRRDGREQDLRVVTEPHPARVVIVRTPDRTVTLNVDSLEQSIRTHVDQLALLSDSALRRLDREAIRLDSGVIRLDSLARVFRIGELERVIQDVEKDSLIERHLEDGILMAMSAGRRALAGAEFAPVNPELGSYFGTDRGVLVLRVAPESPAARAGLKAGDVVVRAGGGPITSLAELRRAVQRAEDDELQVEIMRERRRQELRLQWDRPGREAAR